jgi:hypothetical protein
LFQSETTSFNHEFVIEVPSNPNWFNVVVSFFGTSSSSTSNPYALALVPPSDVYPFADRIMILAQQQIDFWAIGTNSYALGNLPGQLDAQLGPTTPPTSYNVMLAFNDDNTVWDGVVTFTWQSIGPSNVFAKLYPGP